MNLVWNHPLFHISTHSTQYLDDTEEIFCLLTGCRVEKDGQDWKPYSEAKRVRGNVVQSQQSER